MSKRIGVIGSGTAGLHLGLFLQQHGVDVTLYSDKTGDEIAAGRLLNTVAHHATTIANETALGANHWPTDQFGYFGHYYYIGTPEPIEFYGALRNPSRAVDYRIYQPALMRDFESRGGKIVYGEIEHDDVAGLADQYDLLVVSTGKGPLGRMFEHDPDNSPFDRPQRALCCGLFKGIAEPETRAVTMYFAPGVGEMIEIPTYSFSGMVTALVIENHIGAELEVLSKIRYDDDPKAFLGLLYEKLEKFYPTCAARINRDEFDLANGSLDLLQGAVTPTVRKTYAFLGNGTLAVALGDVHAVVDPVLGQGANAASFAAMRLGEQILANEVFDGRFVEKLDGARSDRVLAATRWTNFMLKHLKDGSPELMQFIGAISQHPGMADEFTTNFDAPDKQWDCFASAQRTASWVGGRMPAEQTVPEAAAA